MHESDFDKHFHHLGDARPHIRPESSDWNALLQRLDAYQRSRGRFFRLFPWIVLPLVAGYAVWVSFFPLVSPKLIIGSEQIMVQQDTLWRNREVQVRDTIWVFREKISRVEEEVLKEKTAAPMLPEPTAVSSMPAPVGLAFIQAKGKPEANPSSSAANENNFSQTLQDSAAVPDLAWPVAQISAERLISEKQDTFVPKANSSQLPGIDLSGTVAFGSFLPLGRGEIRNPLAFYLAGELALSHRFSLIPSLMLARFHFEAENGIALKTEATLSNLATGKTVLQEVKGRERRVMPALAGKYYITERKGFLVHTMLGAGLQLTHSGGKELAFQNIEDKSTFSVRQPGIEKTRKVVGLGGMGISLGLRPRLLAFGEVQGGLGLLENPRSGAFVAGLFGLRLTSR